MSSPDALRFALGTLTVVPVRPPGRLDQPVVGRAMALAPVVGVLLGGVASVVVAVVGSSLPAPLTAVLTVAVLAALTRAVHLDGLADVADGLGSFRQPSDALAVMRRGNIGPFGVVTLLLVLAVDITALARAIELGVATSSLLLALLLGRLALPLACRRGVPAARREGQGHLVAGSVSPWLLCASVVVAAVLGLGVVASTASAGWVRVAGAFVAALAVAELVTRHACRRLGGVTGDVLGAEVEVATAAALALLVSR